MSLPGRVARASWEGPVEAAVEMAMGEEAVGWAVVAAEEAEMGVE